MTAFTTAQLPIGARAITTIEEMSAWCASILVATNPTAKFVRQAGLPSENRCQYSSGVDADNTIRNQVLLVLEFDTSKAGQSLPDWKQVKEISTTAIPTAFSG